LFYILCITSVIWDKTYGINETSHLYKKYRPSDCGQFVYGQHTGKNDHTGGNGRTFLPHHTAKRDGLLRRKSAQQQAMMTAKVTHKSHQYQYDIIIEKL
jgi:hypothetical protein